MMSTISNLFFDQGREVDEPINHSGMGQIYSFLLVECIGLDMPIQREYGIDELCNICKDIYKRRTVFAPKEYLLQDLVFTLLTIYSNNTKNCIILEEMFNFVPTLVVTSPSVSTSELYVSIVKIFNYVCQCVEQIAPTSVATLCATAIFLMQQCLQEKDELNRQAAIDKFNAVCASFDHIIKDRQSNAFLMLRYGMLRLMFTEPFENLDKKMKTAVNSGRVLTPIEEGNFSIYAKVIDLLVTVIQNCSTVIMELRRSNLLQITRSLIASDAVPATFAASFRPSVAPLPIASTKLLSWDFRFILFEFMI